MLHLLSVIHINKFWHHQLYVVFFFNQSIQIPVTDFAQQWNRDISYGKLLWNIEKQQWYRRLILSQHTD